MSSRKRLLIRISIVIAASLLLTFFLEARYFLNDAGEAWRFVTELPLVFLYNSLMMLTIITFFSALIKKPFLSIGIVWAALTILTYIHINKFNFRASPLLPEDFQFAGNAGTLTKFIDISALVRMILAVILIIALCLFLDHLTKKYLQTKRHHFLPRLALMVLAVAGLVVGTGFARHHSGENYEKIPWLNSEFVAWNQTKNYDDNGFILGFAYNLGKKKLTAPENYNEQTISSIFMKYQNEKTNDKTRSAMKDNKYNIVIVLGESFYDPEIIKNYYNYEGDVTPNLHKIMSENPSGRMFSPDYGGGTANIEFEVLTNLTNYWANAVPNTDLLPKVKLIPSVASFAKANGYQTTAIHSFEGGMYKRDTILPKEGFDEFITSENFHHTDHDENSQYINDRSAFNETLDLLNSRDTRQLVFLITMQNHAPYDHDIYEHRDFTLTSGYETESQRLDIETYLQMLYNSDKYLGEFIESVKNSNEKTVVLFFGDHSAGVFPAVADSDDMFVSTLAHLTPYFIYTNFDIPEDKSAGAMRLVTTTPNCLTNTMFNLLNSEKPVLGYLLDQVCAENPELAPAYFGDDEPNKTPALTNYELVNYDILGGKNYWSKFTD